MLGSFTYLFECSNIGNVGNVPTFQKITHPQNGGDVGNVTECLSLLPSPLNVVLKVMVMLVMLVS